MSSFIYTKRYQRHPEWLDHSLHSFSLHDPVPACIDIGFYRIGRLMRFRYFRHTWRIGIQSLQKTFKYCRDTHRDMPCSQFCHYVNSFPTQEYSSILSFYFIIISISQPCNPSIRILFEINSSTRKKIINRLITD